MRFIKNRTVIGVVCIALSLLISFIVTPLYNRGLSQKEQIVRVVEPIKIGQQITADMVQRVEVGGFNLPQGVAREPEAVVGKFASADLVPGDYIIDSKIAEAPAAENAYLYSLDGEKQAMSVSVKSFATGLSGKLISGDIVSIIAPDFKKQGLTVIPPELQYVEVIAVTAGSGYDANQRERAADGAVAEEEEKELPATVTLLVTPRQSQILAMLEADGALHVSLVYRGEKEQAAAFIAAQDTLLEELRAAEEQAENGGGVSSSEAESSQGANITAESEESEESASLNPPATSRVESEAE